MPDDPKTDDTIQSESKPNSSEESVSSGASASPKSADETREVKRDYEVSSRPAGVAAPVNLPLTARDLGAPQVLTPAAQTIEGTGSPVTEGDSGNRQHRADSSGSSEREPQAKPFTAAIGVLFYVVVGIAIASINVKARTFIFSRWRWFAGLVLAIGLISGILATRQWFKRATAQRRIGLIIFGVIPLVMISVGTVILLPVAFRAAALRMIFLLCVCLLPATMYYLFIATKKYSILNEFIINLDRLGLLKAGGPMPAPNGATVETEDERKNRVLTYLQKFEAVYGAFPTDLGGLVLQPTDLSRLLYDRRSKSDGSTLASIFTAETTVPVVLTTVLISLGWLITLPPWQGALPTREATGLSLNWLRIFTPEQTPVHFAFIGAYFFSLQMLFRRYVRRDLRASAYVAVSLRIILAVIGIWVAVSGMAALFNRFNAEPISPEATNQLLVLGFIIGVFPRVVWQIVGAVAKNIGGVFLRLPSLQTDLPISDLDGLTVWHESRLEEEDIENVPNMATADLVEMLLNTRFPPDRLIDWVDQAILYTHLGPVKNKSDSPREHLRIQGIRTASALIEGYNRSVDRGDLKQYEEILKDSGAERSPMRSLVDTMQTNPNLRLIQTWRGLVPYKQDKTPSAFGQAAGQHNP